MKNLIVITGGPGSGKTRLAMLLAEWYGRQGQGTNIIDGIDLPRSDKQKEALRIHIEAGHENVIICTLDEYDPNKLPVKASRVIEVKKL